MSQTSPDRKTTFSKGLLWFVGLWLLGVAGAVLLALPFRLLIAAAMHYQH
ncbi:hypothetical protein [Paraburkholderia aromaticivorans]|nr:hypothetical protein [Paraburkholderia aromaticivorans]